MNLLEIQELNIKLRGINPVRGVSLAVKEGEFVGLVGSSGSGKSTLALAILRLQAEARMTGRILFRRQDLMKLSEEELNRIRGSRIAMIFQEPMLSLNPLHTAGRQIMEVLKYHTKSATKERVIELLNLVELQDVDRIYGAYPHELSGGQRQRVMIAMALAGNPDLLIADEPTTALDVTVQAQILDLLKSLQKKLKLSILFITHDLDIIRRLADRVYVMKFGRIIATRLREPEKIVKIRHKPPSDRTPSLIVKNLTVAYDNIVAVRDASFQLYPARTVGLVGESGSGKSTVAKALVRLVPAMGQVILNGRDFLTLKGHDLLEARSRIQMVFQDAASSLNPRLPVGKLLAEGWQLHHQGDATAAVEKALKAVGLRPDMVNRYPHELSGGQKTRVALARILILKPSVLILDEVTSSLDIDTQNQLMTLLVDLQKQYNLSYLFISHDMKAVRRMSDWVCVMKNAVIVESGPADEVFTNPRHEYTRQLLRDSFMENK
ncbi:MAG: ABC transporter ATP-binding protein [Alphaproteobacteria bacterium]|nr:ABC transporter ATP-binding protein [Alphaproteobacteria bacterium]